MLQIVVTTMYTKWDVRVAYTASSAPSTRAAASSTCSSNPAPDLPWLTLMVVNIAAYTRFLRSSMLEVINSDYVRTARARIVERRW